MHSTTQKSKRGRPYEDGNVPFSVSPVLSDDVFFIFLSMPFFSCQILKMRNCIVPSSVLLKVWSTWKGSCWLRDCNVWDHMLRSHDNIWSAFCYSLPLWGLTRLTSWKQPYDSEVFGTPKQVVALWFGINIAFWDLDCYMHQLEM